MAMTGKQIQIFDNAIQKRISDTVNAVDILAHRKARLAERIVEEFPDLKREYGRAVLHAAKAYETAVELYSAAIKQSAVSRGCGIEGSVREMVVKAITTAPELMGEIDDQMVEAMHQARIEVDAKMRRKREQDYIPSRNR